MTGFRIGKFERHTVSAPLRRFCPDIAAESLYQIDPQELASKGKRLILLDLDNTLIGWHSQEIPQGSFDWVQRAKLAGLDLCIISNTRNPSRLIRISERFGIKCLFGRFKPNPALYNRALKEFNVRAKDAIMIGDQLFTDIWGANRAGIESIWVAQMTPQDFIGTKIVSRTAEKWIRKSLHKGIKEENA